MTRSRLMTTGRAARAAARRAGIVPVALAVGGALLLAGCGDQTEGANGGSGGGSGKLNSMLPEKIRSAGVIKVGTDAAYKPMEYKEGADIVGLDPDLADAMGKKLGVRFQFTNGTFDGLITSMQTGRFDMIMSAMTDTKDRQEGLDDKGKKAGKGVDFVDYLSAGSSILVKKGNPEKIESVDEMCGKKVATQRGTTSHEILKTQTKKCVKDGKKKIDVEAYNTDDEARVRLKAGGVVADISDFPVAANAAKSGADFEVVGDQMQSAPYGMAVTKDSKKLRDALKAAMKAIIEDGSYKKALEKWGVQDGGVQKVTINAGT
ncbi:ABC transporter substrate-binding protein [Streptomyces oryzae]|uniref:ABC transporter substrate-binding protein n=1 Tax=Streptomyces oryzae TaxID=1434886 RepID=A0ABS3XF98_9ACTN|nr:ABC transporter substrate-binding protein [Streptomyces oryzae]MBO8194035.1 ABC transporter substrate-binding protein [Streptomyces oryzae]